MLCPVCGRPDGHCRHCHFVHDHMNLLDGTTASNNRIRSHTAPWRVSATVERMVREAWADYQVETVTPRAVGSEG